MVRIIARQIVAVVVAVGFFRAPHNYGDCCREYTLLATHTRTHACTHVHQQANIHRAHKQTHADTNRMDTFIQSIIRTASTVASMIACVHKYL